MIDAEIIYPNEHQDVEGGGRGRSDEQSNFIQQQPTAKVDTATSDAVLLIPDGCWQHALSYLNPQELCRVALVNRKEFYHWSNDDMYWKEHCKRRWKGKQGTTRLFSSQHTSNEHNSAITAESWKQRYAWAEYDKFRRYIYREEISYYRWRLVYNGAESRLGLRQFLPDGTYDSPYMGRCQWLLHENRFLVMNMSLPIERDPETWGGIIGKGSNTVYYSVEAET